MAVSFVNSALVLNTGDNQSSYSSSSFTAQGGADHALVATIGWLDDGNVDPDLTTVSGMTRVAGFDGGAAITPAANVFALMSPSAGNYSVNVTFNDTTRACMITMFELAGVDDIGSQFLYYDQDGNDNPSAAVSAGSMVVGTRVSRGNQTAGITPLVGVTAVVNTRTGGTGFNDIYAMVGYMPIASAGTVTFGGTKVRNELTTVVGVEFTAAAGGVGPTVPSNYVGADFTQVYRGVDIAGLLR